MGDLAGHFRTSRPAISKHLRVLESAGLVVARAQGTSRLCALDARPLRLVGDWLRDYEALDQDEKTINVHVSHLRDKLEDDPSQPAFVQTIRGVGYAFAER